jgi:hypothetical protein
VLACVARTLTTPLSRTSHTRTHTHTLSLSLTHTHSLRWFRNLKSRTAQAAQLCVVLAHVPLSRTSSHCDPLGATSLLMYRCQLAFVSRFPRAAALFRSLPMSDLDDEVLLLLDEYALSACAVANAQAPIVGRLLYLVLQVYGLATLPSVAALSSRRGLLFARGRSAVAMELGDCSDMLHLPRTEFSGALEQWARPADVSASVRCCLLGSICFYAVRQRGVFIWYYYGH